MRATIAAGFALLLAGCGGQSGGAVAEGGNASITVTSVRGGGTLKAGDCKRAAHVPLYADAKITTCVSNDSLEGRKSGSVIFASAAAPGTVLAWYKAEAEKAGLKVNLQTEMSLSASQGGKTMMVMAMAQDGATQVTVNWGE